jgi:hypothetical protein
VETNKKGKSRTSKSTSHKNVKWLFCTFLIFILPNCHQNRSTFSTPAFYHWKTNLKLSNPEQESLSRLQVKKIYTKFFDLDLDAKKQAVPLASLQCPNLMPDSVQIIPTIFITNRTLKRQSSERLQKLAQRIFQKINTIWQTVSNNKIKEIQFDCDWTPSTKENYFLFLKYFRAILNKHKQEACKISATIRLHQIKYPEQTGIPPVDRGMLMFYNMDDLENIETKNSILDLSIAKRYLNQNSDYDLPLDIALPIFRWGVLFRNGKMIKLINNLDRTDLEDTSRFVSLAENQYEVGKSTYLKGYYLYGADVIRLEWVSEEELLDAATFLDGVFDNNENTISLYQLDTSTLKHYTDETLQQVFQIFSD